MTTSANPVIDGRPVAQGSAQDVHHTASRADPQKSQKRTHRRIGTVGHHADPETGLMQHLAHSPSPRQTAQPPTYNSASARNTVRNGHKGQRKRERVRFSTALAPILARRRPHTALGSAVPAKERQNQVRSAANARKQRDARWRGVADDVANPTLWRPFGSQSAVIPGSCDSSDLFGALDPRGVHREPMVCYRGILSDRLPPADAQL